MFSRQRTSFGDRDGNEWVTDRRAMVAYKFTPQGKLVMTVGQKGIMTGDNESKDYYNGVADLSSSRRMVCPLARLVKLLTVPNFVERVFDQTVSSK